MEGVSQVKNGKGDNIINKPFYRENARPRLILKHFNFHAAWFVTTDKKFCKMWFLGQYFPKGAWIYLTMALLTTAKILGKRIKQRSHNKPFGQWHLFR